MIIGQGTWNELKEVIFPWVKSFCKIIKSANPPSFNGNTLWIASDYSGDLPTAKYLTFSYLLTDIDNCENWEIKRRLIRQKLLHGDRTISFKGLNDNRKRTALPHFLDAANSINGMLVTVVVNKQVKDFNESGMLLDIFQELNLLETRWKKKMFKKLTMLTHFLAIIVAGIVRAKQNIYWYSDQDSVFANEAIFRDVLKVFGKLSGHYIRVELGDLGIGTTKLNEPDYLEEDLNAVPDLAAGALVEMFDKAYELLDKNKLGDFSYYIPKNISGKCDQVLTWLGNSENVLKKVTIVFDRADDAGGLKVWRFDVKPDSTKRIFAPW